MSLRTKIAIALLVSFTILGGLFFLLLQSETRLEEAARVEPEAAAARPERQAAPRKEPRPAAVKGEPAKKQAAPGAALPEGKYAPPLAPGTGWTLAGRIVRQAPAAPGEAEAPAEAAVTPAGGVTILLTNHPRRTKAEESPPPQKVVTGPDGRFELSGVPSRIWMRLTIEEPASALRTLSFRFSEPRSETRKELGDLAIEPGASLAIKLVGPRDEPVEKASILVNKDRADPGRNDYLYSLGIRESRREAEERGGGEYFIERVPSGSVYVEVTAAGYAPVDREPLTLPREEPLVVRLAEGVQIAGVVLSEAGEPIEGAELVADASGVSHSHTAKSDAAGRFVFATLGDGSFDVSVSAEGYVSARKGGVATGSSELQFSLAPEAVYAGSVVSEESGSPVAQAEVTLRGDDRSRSTFTAKTDAKGQFAVRKVSQGSFTVGADHPDYAPSTEEKRDLEPGKQIEGEVIRLPRGLSASGKVVDGLTQAAISGALVGFTHESQGSGSAPRRTAQTGADGTFEVKGLREGKFVLAARARGYFASKSQVVSIAAGGGREFTIILEPGSSITGRILDTAGRPIAGATVRPNPAFSRYESWDQRFQSLQDVNAQSDAEGRYLLEGLPPHPNYRVAASHRDYAPSYSKPLALAAREALEDADVTLSRGGTVRGRVVDDKGGPLAGVSVAASRTRGQAAGEEEEVNYYFGDVRGGNATSDRDGNYSLPRLEAGLYSVRAQLRGRASAQRDGIQVAEERALEGIDFTLGEGETLAGRVVDSAGSPIAGARVRAYGPDQAEARSDAEGRFEVKGLQAGQVMVQASMSGYRGEGLNVKVPGEEAVLKLERTAKVLGQVRAKDRTSFQGFQVIAVGLGPDGRGNRSTGSYSNDTAGRFEIEVAPGSYHIQVMVPGFAPSRSQAFTVKSGDVLEGIVIDLAAGGTIQGTVVAAGTAQAVSGAQLSLAPSQDDTFAMGWGPPGAGSQADGSFTIEGVPEGTHTLVANHRDYAQASVAGVSVRAGGTAQVRVELSAGGGIRGVVLMGGRPAAGARVHAWRSDGGQYAGKDATADAEGRFQIKGLAAGEYALQVSLGRGLQRSRRQREGVSVAEGQFTDVTLDEEPGIRLSGRVLAGGVPVRGGRVQAMQEGNAFRGVSHTDITAAGEYALELPGPGTYALMIEWKGRGESGTKVRVTIPPGEPALTQDLELPSGEIAGVVVDAETGEPVRAQVVALSGGAGGASYSALFAGMRSMSPTDDQGRFLLGNLEAGTYSLRAFAEGYADGRLDRVALEDGAAPEGVQIAMERGISFQALVVDAKGQPVAQAMGLLRDAAGELVQLFRPATSNAQGILEFRGVRAGAYRLSAVHQAFAAASAQVKVSAEGADSPTLVLRPGGKVRVRVVNQNSRPVDGAEILLLDERGENVAEDRFNFAAGPLAQNLTRNSGELTLSPIAPGTYRAIAQKGASRSREEKVAVAEGDTAELRLTVSE